MLNVIVISKPGLPHLVELDALPPSANVILGNTEGELEPVIGTADVILNANFGGEPFKTLLPKATRARWIHSSSAGVESMMCPALAEHPAVFTNGKGVFKTSLAEWSIASMLFFSKQLRRLVSQQDDGRWEQFDIELLEGATLGVVGYGEIGRASAQLARAFGMKILAVRRKTSASTADPLLDAVYGPSQLKEMLGLCDYVLVAAPKAPGTIGMIGAAEIAAMKPTAVIMNVGRGPVIDEMALVQALRDGRIRGAALDVFDVEPLPAGHAFYGMKNVLLSPHSADHTADWLFRAMRRFVANYKLFEAGLPLEYVVDKSVGY